MYIYIHFMPLCMCVSLCVCLCLFVFPQQILTSLSQPGWLRTPSGSASPSRTQSFGPLVARPSARPGAWRPPGGSECSDHLGPFVSNGSSCLIAPKAGAGKRPACLPRSTDSRMCGPDDRQNGGLRAGDRCRHLAQHRSMHVGQHFVPRKAILASLGIRLCQLTNTSPT